MDLERTCIRTGTKFLVTAQEIAFYKQFDLPLPTVCPAERRKDREKWMSTPFYSQMPCEVCNKTTYFEYPETFGRRVYCRECRKKNDIKRTPAGVDYIPGKFMEQYLALFQEYPIIGNLQHMEEQGGGGDLTRCFECSYSKSCIECFDLSKCMNLVNCNGGIISASDSADLTQSSNCELCVELVGCNTCYMSHHLQDCSSCENCSYLDNCKRCKNCFGCSGLRDKQYYIFNKSVSKEEYEARLKEFNALSEEELLQGVATQLQDVPVPHAFVDNRNIDCFYTNHMLSESKQVYYGFYGNHCVNAGYVWHTEKIENVWESTTTRRTENAYQASDCSYSHDLFFVVNGFESAYNWYTVDCYKSEYCFGCIGLHEEKYHILNKEYPKEEYERLVKQIRDELNLHFDGDAVQAM